MKDEIYIPDFFNFNNILNEVIDDRTTQSYLYSSL